MENLPHVLPVDVVSKVHLNVDQMDLSHVMKGFIVAYVLSILLLV